MGKIMWDTGESVQLVKGGPEMKVKMHCIAGADGPDAGFDDRPERVICQWFEDGHLKTDDFPPESLERYDPKPVE